MSLRQTIIVDASFNFKTMTTMIGLAIHETDKPHRNGILIDQIGEAYTGIPSGSGEMLAIYRALGISNERGYKMIKIKTDYNYLKKLLKTNPKQQTGKDSYGLVGAILRLSDLFDSVAFQYKPKRTNQMSHKLARTAIENNKPIFRNDLLALCKLEASYHIGHLDMSSV
ncbi:MAG: reverse transcriptase-like protein [Deltaproteobacteria bacterium]|nr:reverse transcriptase-like protein [Deltaproteobacteria bacterium]